MREFCESITFDEQLMLQTPGFCGEDCNTGCAAWAWLAYPLTGDGGVQSPGGGEAGRAYESVSGLASGLACFAVGENFFQSTSR